MPAVNRAPALAREREPDARTRILEAAERLFAEHGYHAVSLRTIMGAAAVNVGAAHYHFGSKPNLLRAVFDRWVAQVNLARRERLAACVDAKGKPAPVEQILAAYIGPSLEVCAQPGGERFVRIAALASVDPDAEVRDIINGVYDETARLFVEALRRACPHLDEADLYWRLNCAYGAMMYVRANNGRVARILGQEAGPIDGRAVKDAMRHLPRFLAAGFAAPSLESRRSG